MQNLKEKIAENKLPALFHLSKIGTYHNEILLDNQPDYDLTSYEGLNQKEYALNEIANISSDYQYIFHVDLHDLKQIDHYDNEEIGDISSKYFIKRIDRRLKDIEFKGQLLGDGFDIGGELYKTTVDIEVVGLTKVDASQLSLYQELMLEGHLLELENNYRMSFFTYFTALESFVREKLEEIKNNTYKELHDKIENLSLRDKISILFKKEFNIENLDESTFWSTLSGSKLIKKAVDMRNDIAHGKHKDDLTQEIVDDCFLLMALLIGSLRDHIHDVNKIRKYLYPKIV
jgi:hypothetical protein